MDVGRSAALARLLLASALLHACAGRSPPALDGGSTEPVDAGAPGPDCVPPVVEPGEVGVLTTCFCSSGGFCWRDPLPQGNALYDVAVVSDDEVWAVGGEGTVLRRAGGSWSRLALERTVDIHGVWAFASDDVWFFGAEGTALRWDGARLARVETGTTADLYSPFALSPTALWVGTGDGAVLRWDGEAFTASQTPLPPWGEGHEPTVLEVWASGQGDVWAAGLWSGAARFDGTSWTAFDLGPYDVARDVWGSAPDDVWIVGGNQAFFRWDGAALTEVPAPPGGVWWQSVDGTGPDDVWVGDARDGRIARWDGDEWRVERSGAEREGILDLEVLSAERVWAVGFPGSLLRKDGDGWTELTTSTGYAPRGVVVDGHGVAWGRGEGALLRSRGGPFERAASFETRAPQALWIAPQGTVWAAGEAGGAWRRGADAWVAVDTGRTDDLAFLVGTSESDLWAASREGAVLRWDGAAWSEVDALGLAEIGGACAIAPGEARFFSGAPAPDGAATILRVKDGVSALEVLPGFGRAASMWAASPSDVWLTGNSLARFDGERWNRIEPPRTPWSSSIVDGTGPEDVWLVGTGGVHHFDGAGFSSISTPGGAVAWLDAREDGIVALRSDGTWYASWAGEVAAVHDRWRAHAFVAAPDGTIWWLENGRRHRLALDEGAVGAVVAEDDLVLHLPRGVMAPVDDETTWFSAAPGAFVRREGQRFAHFASPARVEITALWAFDADEAWAVGWEGSIVRFDGASWQVSPSPVDVALYAVWGSAPDDVWAAGEQGTILRWDGAAWSQVDSPTTRTVTMLAGSSRDEVWGIAEGAEILRWDGSSWSLVEDGVDGPFHTWEHVWVDAPGSVWFVGRGEPARRWDGAALRDVEVGIADVEEAWRALEGPLVLQSTAGAVVRHGFD